MHSRLHICAAMALVLAMPVALEVKAAEADAPATAPKDETTPVAPVAAAGEKVTLNVKGMT